MSGPDAILGLDKLEDNLTKAVINFWNVKGAQRRGQGKKTGRRDAGNRRDVTGGKHVDGLVEVFSELLTENRIPSCSLFTQKKSLNLPGYFRAEKQWDLLVVHNKRLLACLELKSMGSSFGNNFNNRAEEVIGLGHDLRTAFTAKQFGSSSPPWAGYLMLLPDIEDTRKPVRTCEPHFKIDTVFRDSSYQARYIVCFKRLVEKGLYNKCSIILADPSNHGDWFNPDSQLTARAFAASLVGHCIGELAGS